MKIQKPILTVLILLPLLSGCLSDSVRQGPPAPVYGGNEKAPATSTEGDVQIAAVTPPPGFEAAPRPNRAVQVLIDRADAQRRQGDLAGAVASLERALRIAPDHAAGWNRLAHVRAEQRRHSLAAQFAAKSNSLADRSQASLKRDNWQLIADSREASGDPAGAARARAEAARLQ